ncbi:Protein Wnt [Daphnia magna]|uniref:Protein Wnt n=1 Tax=Daphnia magna TaxID=35525 RepID=A0A0N8D0Q2_9CRUS|nr:Protein Wnt [Daphnia magna]
MVTRNLLRFTVPSVFVLIVVCFFTNSHAGADTNSFNRRTTSGKTSLMRRSDLLLSGNSLMNIRRKPDEKRRQKEDKYFFNSVMDRQRRKPRPTSAICKNFPGLSKKQLELCFRYPDVMSAAIGGLQLAVNECQFQFQKHRWNCSALERKNRNPHSSNFLQKGYRETAFAYAISSAGVAHSVSKACGQGKLESCGCDPKSQRGNGGFGSSSTLVDWRWSGCSHNMDFGVKFSRFLLDSRQRGQDIHSRIHLHNSHVGRTVVGANSEIRCKCHGMSGSCEMKTCWKAVPEFRRVGTVLKERFNQAVLVDQSQLGNEAGSSSKGRQFARRIRDTDLLFYERSPNFCEERPDVDYPGITGRRCNKTGDELDNCQSLCCGRGYNVVRQKRTERCHCRFHWCCSVVCNNCTVEQWVTVCK